MKQAITPNNPFKIGTRGSPLALAQAHETRARLMDAWGLSAPCFEICIIATSGDRIQDRSLRDAGGKGLFTKEIEEAMIAGQIDIAVHSMKDMPVLQPEGLVVDTFLPREDMRDALLSDQATRLVDLPQGAVLGTSSLRRKAQALYLRPDLKVVEFRGNVQTRLRKLADGVADATFLAAAGLNRLGMSHLPATPVDIDDMLPAIAQGVIGIERRGGDARAAEMLAAIHDAATALPLAAERAFLAALDGSCQTPIAGLATVDGNVITLMGEILKPDGSARFAGTRAGPLDQAAEIGTALAQALLAEAGADFLKS